MGNESHFASELLNKVAANTAKLEYYKEFATQEVKPLHQLLRDTVHQVVISTRLVKAQIGAATEDLLSTLLIAIIDQETKDYVLVAVGDGLVVIDGIVTDFDQDNKPDYLAYHLDRDFEAWYENLNTIRSGTLNKYIALSTDGIFTFANDLDQRVEGEATDRIIDKCTENTRSRK